MEFNIDTIKVGQYIRVKKGTKAPDFDDQLMDGWQGKVKEITKKGELIEIEWDVQTILNTPYQYLYDIISNGYDHEIMNLLISDLEPAKERKTTTKEQNALYAKLYWIDFYDDQSIDEEYAKIFKDVDVEDEFAMLEKWEEHLSDKLQFPFEVQVEENERGSLRLGTKFKLLAIDDYDDMRGIFGIGKGKMGAINFPICNLEATDQKSENYELLRNYVVWFANR